MAVKGKGKQVASTPPRGSGAPTLVAKRRKDSGDAGPSSSAAAAKRRRRPGVLHFVDDAAGVDDDYEEDEEEDGEAMSEDDLDDGFFTEGKTESVSSKRTERSHPLPFLGIVKEEELSGDELEEFIKDRYASRVKHSSYDGSTNAHDDEFTTDSLSKEPTIWRVKCMVGRERQMAFCFMQKFVDLQKFGTKVPIISAFALDHVRGFVFIEAEKACDVTEACKGFCSVYISRINSVPAAEVPSLLSSRTKPFAISPGTWVRMKNGNYKGDLAQVASADDGRKRVMIKLIPRVDLQAISRKFGGAISLKEAAVPAPRLISSQELEFFRPHMEMKRDRQTGDVFEVLDGLMFKDGFLYKRVALSSLIYWGIQPSEAELLKFSSSPTNKSSTDDMDWVSRMYGPKKRNLPREQDMKASSSKASCSKGKCSKASNLKASTSTENFEEEDGFNLHDLVLFGRKDFGVVIAVEKDGFRILKGGPEGSAVTVRKQDIKKVCADKMFTAVDHKKKIISINDTVNVLEGPFQGKQGVVKHLYMGILFIYNESESENNGYFCAQCGSCENVKKRKELESSTSANLEESSFPMFSYDQNEQRENERPYRSTREQLFSIGETLRIRKGPLKGYLCRVVRIFRNDVTVKLDSLLKIVTVQAEFLSVPVKLGNNSSGAPSGSFGNQDAPFFGSEANKTSWDNGLPSFGSDSWQPFSSSAVSVQNADGGSEADPWCKNTAPSADDSDQWGTKTNLAPSAADDSDPWGTKTNSAPSAADDSDPWSTTKKSASIEVWNNSTTEKESSSVDVWDKQPAISGSNVGGNSWDRAAADKESEKTDNWGEASKVMDRIGYDTDPWGSKVKEVGMKEADGWGKASMQPEKSKDDNHGWDQPVGKSNQNEEKSADKSTAWGGTVTTNCIRSSSSGPGREGDDAWSKSDTLPVAQDDAWGKSKDNSSDGAVGWNEARTSNQSCDSGGWDTAAANWNKSSAVDGRKEAWGKSKDNSSDGAVGWNEARISNQSCDAGGWDTAAANWNKSSAVDGHKEAWGKEKDTTAIADKNNENVNWDKARLSDQVCGSSWGNSKFTSGDGPSSWNKGEEVGGDSENSSWSRPGGNPKGGSGWGNSKFTSGDGPSSWNKREEVGGDSENSSWSRPGGNPKGGYGFMRGRGRGRESRDFGGRNDEGSWKNSWGENSSGRPSWRSGSQVDSEAGDSGGYRGRGRGRGQYGGRGRGDNGWQNGGRKSASNDWNAPNSSINQPWSSSSGTKSTWNSSEDKNSSRGEQNDSWASKISSKGQEQESDAWASKMTSAGAEDKNDHWVTKTKESSFSTGGKWGDAASGEEQQNDPWASKIGSSKESSWGGFEAGPKKEGSWEKGEGSGSQGGGSNTWDKADGGWNSKDTSSKDTQGDGGSSWDKADGGWNSKGWGH